MSSQIPNIFATHRIRKYETRIIHYHLDSISEERGVITLLALDVFLVVANILKRKVLLAKQDIAACVFAPEVDGHEEG